MIKFVTCLFMSLSILTSAAQSKEKENHSYAVLAGGCFWGVEHLFSKQDGIIDVVSGYTGGNLQDPSYEDIVTGSTGHAEAVQVTYDPNVISYEKILKFFFQIHDPTTLNRQQNDIGTQYRSAIFYANATQKNTAYNVIAQGNASGVFDKPIVTTLEQLEIFYPAEDYHQDYLAKKPHGYNCHKIRDDWAF